MAPPPSRLPFPQHYPMHLLNLHKLTAIPLSSVAAPANSGFIFLQCPHPEVLTKNNGSLSLPPPPEEVHPMLDKSWGTYCCSFQLGSSTSKFWLHLLTMSTPCSTKGKKGKKKRRLIKRELKITFRVKYSLNSNVSVTNCYTPVHLIESVRNCGLCMRW